MLAVSLTRPQTPKIKIRFLFVFRILGDSENTIMLNNARGDNEHSFSGSNFVNWLSSNDIARDRYAAIMLAQHLLDLLLIKAGMISYDFIFF